MTANELNTKAQELLDAIWGPISEFQGLRLQADDATWEAAADAQNWLDKLCDIEFAIEQ